MNKKKSASAGIMSFCGEYSYILVFIAIFIVYAFTSSGLTWSGVMNVFRHSAVIGIIGIGMGLVCLTGEIDLSVGAMLALDGGFSVIIFNMTDSILLTFLFAIVFGAFCAQDRKKLRRVEKLQKNCVKRTSRGLLNSVKERIWNSLQKMLSVLI